MSERTIGFIPQPNERDPLKKYIGQYVIIFPQHGTNFAGYLENIDNDWVTLNPHQGGIHTQDGLERKLIDAPAIVNKQSIMAIEPTTKESLENYCTQQNKKDKETENP